MSEAPEQGMKPLSEMSHYEVLEIAPEAGAEDVERAYRLALATYGEDSLATYSVYDEVEAEGLRERIEMAYQVLRDPERRLDYDRETGGLGPVTAAVEIALQLAEEEEEVRLAPDAVAPEIETFDDVEEDVASDFDGARLRRARLRRGIGIERVATVTKISASYLRCIEEEQFSELPAAVYVRGFVTAYARCIGLDPERVTAGYMDRLTAARPGPRSSGSNRSGRSSRLSRRHGRSRRR